MAQPKKKMSKARTRTRRAHDALPVPGLSTCATCGALKRSHRVCAECGHYRGRQVVEVVQEDEV